MKPSIIQCALALFTIGAAAFAAGHTGKQTALDKFIRAPDSNYRYQLVKTIPGQGYTAYVLDMTSQAWPPADELTDHPLWKHWLTVIKPDQVEGTTGFLFITGGSVKDGAPARVDPGHIDNALTSHSVVAELRGIPNEPLIFKDEGKSRNEDQIIAYMKTRSSLTHG